MTLNPKRIYEENPKLAQFLRFCINGVLAAGIHYVVYVLAMMLLEKNVAYSIGYITSFVINYFITCYWTFKSKPTWKHFVGFASSHVVNYLIHVVLFYVLTLIGVHELIAPILVLLVAVPTNFLILRFVYKH